MRIKKQGFKGEKKKLGESKMCLNGLRYIYNRSILRELK
jgi:hypothetical protein